MRRILAGGCLGITLGLTAAPAAAQTPAWLPQNAPPQQTGRAARLGRPVLADNRPVTDPAVTPVGLIARSQAVDPSRPMTPAPMSVMPSPMPMGGAVPSVAPPAAMQLPNPRPIGPGGPNVTELRDAATLHNPGYTIGTPMTVAPPVMMGQPQTFVAPPGIESPMFADNVPTIGGAMAGANHPDRWYVGAEYLMWWTKSANLPPLLTTGPAGSGGFLGAPGTQTLVGGDFDDTQHNGFRIGGGHWFGCQQLWGVDASFFYLNTVTTTASASAPPYPVVARPFFNVNQGVPFSEIVAATGLATGTATVQYDNSLWGAEVNARRFLWGTPSFRLDGLMGYRYMRLGEGLTVTEQFARTPGSPASIGVPDAMAGLVQDSFKTVNQFHGGQIGLVGELRRGRWYLDGKAKIALGTVYQTAEIGGSQQIMFSDGSVRPFPGGLLAQQSNMGKYTQNQFAVLPEVGLNLGYHLTQNTRIFVGYNLMYLSNVLRPGDQIDQGLDVARIPNFLTNPPPALAVTRPVPTMRTSDFFAQGISFGLQFTW